MATVFSTKCFLFVYMYIDLLKLKAYVLFENSDADLASFLKKPAYITNSHTVIILAGTIYFMCNDACAFTWFVCLLPS